MNEYCGLSGDHIKKEASKRRIGRLRWRAARMAVLLGGFLYEGKKELDEDDRKIISQAKKWLEETEKIYCLGSIENYDVTMCAEINAILMAFKLVEGEAELSDERANLFIKTAFNIFIQIANQEKEKYFLDKLINTNCEGYCMIKHLSGESEL